MDYQLWTPRCRVCRKTLDISSPLSMLHFRKMTHPTTTARYHDIHTFFLSSKKRGISWKLEKQTRNTLKDTWQVHWEKIIWSFLMCLQQWTRCCAASLWSCTVQCLWWTSRKSNHSSLGYDQGGIGWKVKTVNSLRVDASSTKYRGDWWFTHLQNFERAVEASNFYMSKIHSACRLNKMAYL